MRRAGVVLLVLAVLPTGCEWERRAGDLSEGEALYIERCLDCHGDDGEETVKNRSRPLRDLTTDEITETLKQYQRVTDGLPWWAEFKSGLTDGQIRDLLAYLGTLKAG